MYFKDHKFQHDAGNINKAMGFSEELANICRERIFFCHFINSLKMEELYGIDSEDTPKELTTVSGDLQKVMTMIDNEQEYACTLLYFIDYQQMAIKAFKHYITQKNDQYSEEDKTKLKLMKLISKLVKDDSRDIITLDSVADRIKIVKKANYNFAQYMQLLGYDYNPHPDVDDLLNGVFGNKDDGE